MGVFDNISDKSKDMMSDPAKKEQIERMARDHGISIEEAKERITKRESSSNE